VAATIAAVDSQAFDAIYATDLVYEQDCWKLCGDAHCCHYDRYKRFGPASERGVAKIPMLPGEWDYMERNGFLAGYREPRLDRTVLEGRGATFVFEMLVAQADAACPCTHASRPTFCRLYPMMPVFEVDGRLKEIDPLFGVFEEMERLMGAPPACQVKTVPPPQQPLLDRICDAIGSSPRLVFAISSYRTMKRLFRERMEGVMKAHNIPAYAALPLVAKDGEYVDRGALVAELDAMLAQFREIHAGFTP
jgi:hypothetical protein